ncbi:glycosyltransferase 87 family protein [Actinomadura macrotermitis]|uniref:DUF2029 domain-containing protein n=1 Tax=Actinomadura macrotermitis TaxID=2585200 RepID=A0A7K0BV95_9ACTN|nr:glycosyltransferase 87 family protein [Actinomadura macrotermitis]MQY05101.1 hypothetical protein [Actinomadura macrotermitis]
MDHAFVIALLLVGAAGLAAWAQWRGLRPPLWAALAVGIALRGALLALAATSDWQPADFILGFQKAGQAVQAGQDPVLASEGSWHFLPMIPYFYGAALSAGLPWVVAGRLCTILADVALIVLVGRLARPEWRAQAAFWYACSPLALMVSVLHGQIQAVALAFLAGAFLAARAGRSVSAGALFGLALSSGSWPVILLPVVLSMLPTWRRRLYGLVAAGAVPLLFLISTPLLLHTSWRNLVHVSSYLGGVRPIVGGWGWTAVLTGGQPMLNSDYARIGQLVLYATLAVVAYLWRRADPLDLALAMLLAFLVVTPRMGSQYLLFFTPFLCARPTRWARPALAACGVWAAVGYLYLTQYDDAGWWARHIWWSQLSLPVIALLVLAMPDRGVADRESARPRIPVKRPVRTS